METLHEQRRWPYRELTTHTRLAYASYMRWKGRWRRGEPVVRKPGPKKALPLDLKSLACDLQALRHGAQRTAGTGALYARYRLAVSRRALGRRVRWARLETHRREREQQMKIEWHVPGLVWSMDPTHGEAHLLHVVQDLASRYKFDPRVERSLPGDRIGQSMERLFAQYGPPLFLKRDNGSNLNEGAVDEVLGRWGVMPLNSPVHYPPYNGGIERAVREIKEQLMLHPNRHSPCAAGLSAQECNHKRRPCLGGRTSCEVFGTRYQAMSVYTARKRREVFDWIKAEQARILHDQMDAPLKNPGAAWRRAVETWLLRSRAVTLTQNGKVLPCFPEKRSHK